MRNVFLFLIITTLIIPFGLAIIGDSNIYYSYTTIEPIATKNATGAYNAEIRMTLATDASSNSYNHSFFLNEYNFSLFPYNSTIYNLSQNEVQFNTTPFIQQFWFNTSRPSICTNNKTQYAFTDNSCTPYNCDSFSCLYFCENGSIVSSSITTLDSERTFRHNVTNTFTNHVQQNFFSCIDRFGVKHETNTTKYTIRNVPIYIHWSNTRSAIGTNQETRFFVSLTNNNTLDNYTINITRPDSSEIIITNTTFNLSPSIDYLFSYDFNQTAQLGFYNVTINFTDNYSNYNTTNIQFTTYAPITHRFTRTSGDTIFNVHYFNRENDQTLITTRTEAATHTHYVPNRTIYSRLLINNESFVIQTSNLNLSQNISFTLRSVSNDTSYANLQIGNTSRYKPIMAYEFTTAQNDSNYRIGFDADLVTNYQDALILKAPISGANIDYSNARIYGYDKPKRQLYYDASRNEVYLLTTEFSVFLLLRDDATSEICNNGFDDDYDQLIDEGCSGDTSDGGGGSGGSGGGGVPYFETSYPELTDFMRKDVSIYQNFGFDYLEKSYKLTFREFVNETAILVFSPRQQILEFKNGETKLFDIDGDITYDANITVTFESEFAVEVFIELLKPLAQSRPNTGTALEQEIDAQSQIFTNTTNTRNSTREVLIKTIKENPGFAYGFAFLSGFLVFAVLFVLVIVFVQKKIHTPHISKTSEILHKVSQSKIDTSWKKDRERKARELLDKIHNRK